MNNSIDRSLNKRQRDFDSNSDYSSPRRNQRRYSDRNPRDQQRRRIGGRHSNSYHQHESAAQQLSDNFLHLVWSLGDSDRFDFRQEIPELIQSIESHFQFQSPEDVLKAFRIAAAELPHKLPHLALLISFLSIPPPSEEVTEANEPGSASIGVQIIRDLARTFQLHIDNRRWRSTRLYLHLFGHLHALSRPLVSSQSLLALLRAIFSATTDELTCTCARADECLRIICEGLLRSNLLRTEDPEIKKEVNELVDSIRVHMVVNRRLDRSLFNEPDSLSQYIDPIEELVAALDGAPIVGVLPVLDEAFNPLLEMRINASKLDSPYPKPFDLPIVLLPPDVDEHDLETHPSAPKPHSIGNNPGPIPLDSKDRTNYLGVKFFLRLFDDDTVPNRATADGVVLRNLVNDVIDIFEVNRKECAKILLELPRWVGKSTFQTKAAAINSNRSDEDANQTQESSTITSQWILEHLLLESILTSAFATPTPPIRPIVYYYSLIVELCRLSPSTVAPALGKSVRRLYGGLGETGTETLTTRLEPEGVRRFAEWFAVHLSNFGFLWAWKDWTEVSDLPVPHPKRVLVSRVIELEIRLSYNDRIKETLPSVFIDAGLVSSEAPGPIFEYEDPAHREHLAALDVVQLLKRKESVSRLLDYITKMQARLSAEGIQESADDVARDVTVQALLHVGSRSFSHFLNILERYLELLRNLTNSTNARGSLLQTVSKFWSKNAQFELIVIDKLLEYRVIDPIDSLRHSFETCKKSKWGEIQFWDGVKLTIEKVTRRVKARRSKLAQLKKDEEDQRDRQRAAGVDISEHGTGPANLTEINMKDGAEGEEEKTEVEKKEEVVEEEKSKDETELVQKELERIRREEIETTERELEANLAEQVIVLAETITQFALARAKAEEEVKKFELETHDENDPIAHDEENGRSNGDDNENRGSVVDPKAVAFWKAWWLRGWCREFYRLFGGEISSQFEEINEKLTSFKHKINQNNDENDNETKNQIKYWEIFEEKIQDELRLTKDWIENVGFQPT